MPKVKNLQGDTLESSQTELPKRSSESQQLYDEWTISASGLSAFTSSPLAFKAYKEKEDDSKEKHFELGTAIHCRVLEPDEFDERYYIMEAKAPSGMMGTFVDRYHYYTTNDYDPGLAKEMAYKESGFKTKLETVWNKFETDAKTLYYWDALKNADGKIVLSEEDALTIENCAASVMEHKVGETFLTIDVLDQTKQVHTELDIRWEMKGFDFKMRSILDRVVFDTENKVVNIIDLKTTSKNVHRFAYSYENFSYYRQMAFYGHAAMWYVENVLKEDKKEWAVTTAIVAVQTTGYNEAVVYSPAPLDMQIGHREIIDLLTDLTWHFDNNKWDYPTEYYLSGGIVPLALDPAKYGYSNTEVKNGSTSEHTND